MCLQNQTFRSLNPLEGISKSVYGSRTTCYIAYGRGEILCRTLNRRRRRRRRQQQEEFKELKKKKNITL
jgi:hypothetical protein